MRICQTYPRFLRWMVFLPYWRISAGYFNNMFTLYTNASMTLFTPLFLLCFEWSYINRLPLNHLYTTMGMTRPEVSMAILMNYPNPKRGSFPSIHDQRPSKGIMHTTNARHIKLDATIAGPLLMLSAALLFTLLNITIKSLGPSFSVWDIGFYRFWGGIVVILSIF